MTTTAYDFRDQEPMWVRYAEWVGQGHDKFYEVRVDLAETGVFVLTRRFGPRPDKGKGQIKVEEWQTLPGATAAATKMFRAKIDKGYKMVERPDSADAQVSKDDEYDEDED